MDIFLSSQEIDMKPGDLVRKRDKFDAVILFKDHDCHHFSRDLSNSDVALVLDRRKKEIGFKSDLYMIRIVLFDQIGWVYEYEMESIQDNP